MWTNGLWLLLVLIFFSSYARAALPLTVEDLITDKGKIKLDISLSYANSDNQGISTGEPVLIQTGLTSFISLPTLIEESRGNTDSMVATAGLRYGLSDRAELYVRTSYLSEASRTTTPSSTNSSSEHHFVDAWTGINYQFKSDDHTPALLGFSEIALRERHTSSSSAFRSMLFGVTTYRAIDPIVFSLTAAYRLNRKREDGRQNFKPGNLLLINPSAAFAANDRVTLTTGMQWTSRAADVRDRSRQGVRRTSSDLILGVGYGVSKETILNLTFKSNVSGSNGADLRLNCLHSF